MIRTSARSRRVALTLAGLLAADAALVAVLAYLLRPWLGPVVGDRAGLVAAAAVVPATAALAAGQLRYARRETLAAADARPLDDGERPELRARLARLARTADARVPELAIAETDAPNSLTVGGLGRATVVVSTGLLDRLDGDELDAVLAHELAHLRNRDATVMTLATFLPALASEDRSTLSALGGPVERRLAVGLALVVGYAVSSSLASAPAFSPASVLAFGGLVAFTALFGGVALGVLAIPAVVLSGRLSREREFAADRAGALISGEPAAMASALERLDAGADGRPSVDLRAAGIRELCFLPHGLGDRRREADDGGGLGAGDPLAELPLAVATHPPTEERVARLRDVAARGEAAYQRS
ncbi:M48 family metallopeptidase [Halorussus marinus]|uniref:M48 family metallopeptidase n=1 Tax=Halorussus marinus TaxID=2505976 RepID=UPI00106ED1B9|nr:M48 family metalloprotease [Halorussus marinus]